MLNNGTLLFHNKIKAGVTACFFVLVWQIGGYGDVKLVCHSEECNDEESLLVDMLLLERFFATLRMTSRRGSLPLRDPDKL